MAQGGGGAGFPRAGLPERVETPRLLLRPCAPADVPCFVPLIGDAAVARWLARVPHPYTEADGRAWVALSARQRVEGTALDLLALRRDDGAMIGGVGLQLGGDGDGGGEPPGELGYWVGTPHQRAGYGREMVAAMLAMAFGPLGLPAVWAVTDPANEPSRALLAALGFRQDGASPSAFPARGRAVDAPRFVMTAALWRSLQGEVA